MPKTESKTRIRDPERTRRMIIDAAKELIASEGSDSLSVSKVARTAGVNRGTAYLHFKDRDELLSETIASVRMELIKAIRESSQDMANWAPGDDSAMERIANTLGGNARLVRIWLAELVLGDSGERDPIWDTWREGLSAMRETQAIDEEIDEEVLAVIGLITSMVWPIVTHAEQMTKSQLSESAKRFAAAFDRIILNGILKR